jgi:hypothetical protein
MDLRQSLNGLILTTAIFLQLLSNLDARNAMEADLSTKKEI